MDAKLVNRGRGVIPRLGEINVRSQWSACFYTFVRLLTP